MYYYQQNGYPYGTGMPPVNDFAIRQYEKEKLHVKRLSWGAAAATGGFFLIANLLYGFYYMIPGTISADMTEKQIILSLSVDLLITMAGLLIPFGLVYGLFTKKLHTRPISLEKSTCSKTDTLLFIGAGCGMLLLSSYLTSYLTTLFETMTGITFQYGFFETPTTALGLVIFYIRSALMPALLEEFAMRGVVMQPLRRYGDLFALTMSSMVFALMHGNMIQAPFAFLAGFILGYAVMRTGTLWTSIIIHGVNNAFSVTVSIVNDNGSEQAAAYLSAIGSAVIILIGVVCIALLMHRKKLAPLAKNRSFLPSKQCYRHFILTVPMILVLLYMLFQTAMMVDLPDISDLSDFASQMQPW